MPKHPIYTHFLSEEAQAVIGEIHRKQRQPARCWKKEGFAIAAISTSSTVGRRWSVILRPRAGRRKADWWKSRKGAKTRALATIRHVWSPMKTLSPLSGRAGACRSANFTTCTYHGAVGCAEMSRGATTFGWYAFALKENRMTLWISGDWITGRGERRRKTNHGECGDTLAGNEALMRHRCPGLSGGAHAARFLVGPDGLLPERDELS